MEIYLKRTYYPEGTNGILISNSKKISYSIELPWLNNQIRVSCIPEGKYELRKRFSQRFGWHIELKDVEDRNLILLHPANYALKELKGCIAPVTQLSGPGLGLQSVRAFKKLRTMVYAAIDRGETVFLIVEPKIQSHEFN